MKRGMSPEDAPDLDAWSRVLEHPTALSQEQTL